jgi:hypothetical protein
MSENKIVHETIEDTLEEFLSFEHAPKTYYEIECDEIILVRICGVLHGRIAKDD